MQGKTKAPYTLRRYAHGVCMTAQQVPIVPCRHMMAPRCRASDNTILSKKILWSPSKLIWKQTFVWNRRLIEVQYSSIDFYGCSILALYIPELEQRSNTSLYIRPICRWGTRIMADWYSAATRPLYNIRHNLKVGGLSQPQNSIALYQGCTKFSCPRATLSYCTTLKGRNNT